MGHGYKPISAYQSHEFLDYSVSNLWARTLKLSAQFEQSRACPDVSPSLAKLTITQITNPVSHSARKAPSNIRQSLGKAAVVFHGSDFYRGSSEEA